MKEDKLLLLVFHWLLGVSPSLECSLLLHHIHLGPAEQISNEQSVGLVDTASALPSRPEKVGTIDGDKQNMGQGAKKKNKSFLSRIFRRK